MLTVHAIALDDFGAEFGRCLADRFAVEVMSGDDAWAGSAAWPPARLRVVAGAHEALGLLELVDELSFGWRQAWLPVTRFAPGLRVGPLVVPGRSACFGCFRRLPPGPEEPQSGPSPLDSTVAAARAAVLAVPAVEAALTGNRLGQEAGWLRRDAPDGRATLLGPTTGVPGCPRCRPTAYQGQSPGAQL
ncbi:hypothetical protein [Motilibacter deserti]|uniref:Bacteriocin biosynthesis cyclodehydratase domain-containing protein n=1 Tax=Motilibacter deserti TaxID=2714956 RepID=A0ABX0H5D6_9ACTN|nr:hypothetical protein [Motilibacter deserti]NHC16638.1 hypothetical protein [Motilibacter deserti]